MICNGVWGTNPFISKWISGFGHVWASNEPFLGTIILRLPSPMIEMCYPCWYPSRCNGKDINWRLFWATPVTLPRCCFFTRRYPLTRVVLWHDCIPSLKKNKGVSSLDMTVCLTHQLNSILQFLQSRFLEKYDQSHAALSRWAANLRSFALLHSASVVARGGSRKSSPLGWSGPHLSKGSLELGGFMKRDKRGKSPGP